MKNCKLLINNQHNKTIIIKKKINNYCNKLMIYRFSFLNKQMNFFNNNLTKNNNFNKKFKKKSKTKIKSLYNIKKNYQN